MKSQATDEGNTKEWIEQYDWLRSLYLKLLALLSLCQTKDKDRPTC